jgi:tetratricopeptide (TPR) repeat protein
MKRKQTVLPPGWYEEFFSKADLESSYEQLQAVKHFYGEAMRGRIRSLQVRVEEAWDHFDRALKKSLKAAESIPNLVRQFVLNVYCFENALLEEPIEKGATIPAPQIPSLPRQVLEDYPEVRYVLRLRRSIEASLRLHLGDYEPALEGYRELVDAERDGSPDMLASYYLGLAATQHNMGRVELAEQNLHYAGRVIKSGAKLLNQTHVGSTLAAFYDYLEAADEAAEWRQFVEDLPCPEATKESFRKRGELVVERSVAEKRLVLL